jgi:AcrR family transcriptional regulator
MTTPTRPRGRRPGRSDTQGTIRAAANTLFLRDGYEKVSLRAVAREAEVDPALVHHYFASKAALFLLALTGATWEVERDVTSVLDGPTEGVGRRAVRLLLEHQGPTAPAPLENLMDGPNGDGVARARAAIEMVAREVFLPVATHFGHVDATLRAQLAASALVGVQLGRRTSRPHATSQALLGPLARTLQYYLVDPW